MTVNVGVIGVGYWGKKHVEEYLDLPMVKINSVCDINEENLSYCSDNFGITNTTTDYNKILSLDEIEAVSVCTSNDTHFKICKKALKNKKHVLVEKPMTLHFKEAKELVEIALKKEKVLSVGHIFRFNNALTEVKRLISKRFFGKIFLIEENWTNRELPYKNRDVIIDLAPHTFDILNYLLDEWPNEILCVGEVYRRSELEETAYIISKFKSGVLAHTNISWLFPEKKRVISIIGENRSATINVLTQDVIVYESGYTYNLGIERNNTIKSELLHFVESLINPEVEIKNSGMVGTKTIELIEIAKKSLAEKRTIIIDS